MFNVLSASTFLVGSVLAYLLSFRFEVFFLVPFAAGNFLYIGASDLVPEVNKHREFGTNVLLFLAFTSGLLVLLGIRVVLGGE